MIRKKDLMELNKEIKALNRKVDRLLMAAGAVIMMQIAMSFVS